MPEIQSTSTPDRQKALSVSAALNCEYAVRVLCTCRCNGAMHGKARGKLSSLPVTDPHSPSSECKQCKGTGILAGYNAKINDWDENFPCRFCGGKGRIIKRAVMKTLARLEQL